MEEGTVRKVYQRSKGEQRLPSPGSSLFVPYRSDGTNSDSNSDKDFPKPPPGGPPLGGPGRPPPGGPGGPPPGPPPNDGNEDEAPPPVPPLPGTPAPGLPHDHLHQNHLNQDHPHQRGNLNRVKMNTHHPSNLKVIDRYDSSSKGPNAYRSHVLVSHRINKKICESCMVLETSFKGVYSDSLK